MGTIRVMKRVIITAAAMGVSASAAFAGGLDRSGQPIGIIFQDGNYAELSFGYTSPEVSGNDLASTLSYGNVAGSFGLLSGGIKYDFNDQISLSLIVDEPFGADVTYPTSATTPLLSGTSAIASSRSVTGVVRYKFNENVSVHGGLRLQRAKGNITLAGLAFGGLDGYNVELESDTGAGYVVGAAYEIPEIALRVALTYNSAIDHTFDSIETVGGFPVTPPDTTEIETPASWNLDFQTGVAENTLVFGSIRYAEWENFLISPTFFAGATGGGSISSLDNSTSYSLGVGRRFSDKLSASIAIGYEAGGSDDLVSPLAPSNGNRSLSVGAQYALNDQVTLSGGVRYTKLGDARPETGTPDTARATFTNNDALSVGIRVGYSF